MTDHEDEEAFRAIRAQLDRMQALRPGLAKADPRDAQRGEAHRLFRVGFDALTREGWSQHKIARAIHCDVSTLNSYYHFGDQKRTQLQGWTVVALLKLARIDMVREIMSWSEPPPASKTGTNDR
jgi:hypothetical protein